MMKAKSLHCIAALGLGLALGQAADPVRERVAKGVATELPSLVSLYKHFHANPELSFMEVETAKRLAAELRAAGLKVTTGVGGHGIVGILKMAPALRCLFVPTWMACRCPRRPDSKTHRR